ncbi:MAG: hypothetical protein EBT92_14030 [Planctomycetes bacterium]|nr:hypothetical protein [Planctomycetota bacterium]
MNRLNPRASIYKQAKVKKNSHALYSFEIKSHCPLVDFATVCKTRNTVNPTNETFVSKIGRFPNLVSKAEKHYIKSGKIAVNRNNSFA